MVMLFIATVCGCRPCNISTIIEMDLNGKGLSKLMTLGRVMTLALGGMMVLGRVITLGEMALRVLGIVHSWSKLE